MQGGGAQIGGMAMMLGGRLLGSFFGPVGAAVGGLAGGLIGSLLFNRGAKPLVPDGTLATSAYGNFIPILYGQGRFPATVIWNTDITVKKHGIGKGGQSTNSYYQSAAFAFCNGPARLLKVWLDGKLFYDLTSINPTELTKFKFYGRIYGGTEDQMPDPTMTDWVSKNAEPPNGNPAYRGLCYIMFQQVDLIHFGNRMPNVTASWATDFQENIIHTEMHFLSDDVSDVYSETTGLGAGTGIDWATFRLYWVTSDGSVRVFDMMTGACIKASTFDDLWGAFPEPTWLMKPDTGAYFPTYSAGVTQGGNLYIATKAAGYPTYDPGLILTIDPGTLRVINSMPNREIPNPWKMVPFQLVSVLAEAPVDLLLLIDVSGRVSFINPQTGAQSAIMQVGWAGIDTTTTAVIGKQDTLMGTVDIWFLNSNFLFDSDGGLYIYKTVINGADPSAAAIWTTQEALLHASDFGVTTPHHSGMQDLNGVYDPADDTLIISAGFVALAEYTVGAGTSAGRAIKWFASGDNGIVIWISPREAVWSNSITHYYTNDAGIIGNGDSGNNYWVTASGSGTIDGAFHAAPAFPTGFILGYNSGLNAMVSYSGTGHGIFGDLNIIYLQRVAPGDVAVAAILTDLCMRAGIEQAAIDVSGVTATTVGYSITEEKSYGAAVNDLCQTYQIDMTESDYKLKFVQRGNAPVVTIPQADLGPIDQDPSHYWEQKRAQEQEMPLQLNVKYADPDLDFQPGASYAKRIALPVPTIYSRRVKSVDLPVAIRNNDARHVAESWLYTMWAERDTYKTMLGQRYLYLDPTDNVTVNFASGDHVTARITTTDIGDNYSLKLDLSSEDETTYVVSSSPGALVSYQPQTITQTAFIDLLQFNVPLLQDSDDLGGASMRIYWAGGPTAPLSSSASASLYQSLNGDAWPLYADADMFADWGTTAEALGSTVAAFSTDYVNTLTFNLALGSTSPVGCTYFDMMNGANPALVGGEIIQFQNVVENADGTYTIDTLLRGRRGTEWAVGTHQVGEHIIFLELGAIQPGKLALSLRSQVTLWKLVPAGRFIDSTPADSFAYRGFDLMPYAPVNAKRTLSGGNLLLTWIRRTRIGGLLIDGTDTAPLNEGSEQYEVYLLDSGGALANFDPTVPATYRRAFLGLTSSSVTYTATQMAADGFDITLSTLFAVIYQISAVVGRGFPGFHELPPPGGSLTVGLEDGTGAWSGWVWG